MSELDWEKSYWGNCCNTFDEDQKHYVYANFMELKREHYSFDVEGKRIIDFGGGPSSMLLKCKNLKSGWVIDPIQYPEWTMMRYNLMNIDVIVKRAEDFAPDGCSIIGGWDEAWIYNCLQHTDDPKKIIKNAMNAAPVLRIFEWIDVPAHDGHPHMLTKEFLDDCIGKPGSGTVTLSQSGCYGKAYYGVFGKDNDNCRVGDIRG